MREEQVPEAGRLLVEAAEKLPTTKAKNVGELKHELAHVGGDLHQAGEALMNPLDMS